MEIVRLCDNVYRYDGQWNNADGGSTLSASTIIFFTAYRLGRL